MESLPLKTCTKCGELKPATTDYFPRCKALKSGLKSECKKCACARTIRHTRSQPDYEARQQRKRERAAALEQAKTASTKTCSHCRQEFPKSRDYFHKGSGTADGLSSICRACAIAKTKLWEAENPERVIEGARAWRQRNSDRVNAKHREWRVKNPDKAKESARKMRGKRKVERAEYNRAWNLRHPGRIAELQKQWRGRNTERVRESARRWAKQNPEKRRATYHRTRAKRLLAPGAFTSNDVARILELQQGRCHWCGTPLEQQGKDKYHVDHRIALAAGGTNNPNNLVCACPSCNQRKHSKMPWEFNGRLL